MALSLTRAQAAEKAFNMASAMADEESGLTIPDVELMIDDCAANLCEQIAKTDSIYRLHSDTAVSVTAGVGSIPVAVMMETIPSSMGGRVTFIRTDVSDQFIGDLKFLTEPSKLGYPRPGGNSVGYFSLRGNGGGGRLYVNSGSGTPASGIATILAAQYYTFATMPAQLENEFIALLADMAKSRLDPSKSAAMFAPILSGDADKGNGSGQ